MPTYEYECTRCTHQFEKFQSMTAEPLKRCPKCRCKVRRLFGTGAGIIFKGSGFYETDYRSESYKSGQKKDTASSDSSTSSKSSSADKKSSSDKKSSASDKKAQTKKKAKKD